MVASPSAFDPLAHPVASRRRRNLVLDRMRAQGYLDPVEYAEAKRAPIPTEDQVTPPKEDTTYPYFTSWVKQQVVDELGGGQVGALRAFEGGAADPHHDRLAPAGRRAARRGQVAGWPARARGGARRARQTRRARCGR